MSDRIQPLIQYLENRDALSLEELNALKALPVDLKSLKKGDYVVHEGDRPLRSCLVLDGLAARTNLTAEGRRHITAVHIGGDFVDLHSLLLKQMDHAVVALNNLEVAFVAHVDLLALIKDHDHLGRLLWLSTVIDAAIQRAWTAAMGSRSAADHMACLLCELFIRLRAQGMTRGNSFNFPVTQADLGDMLGLSAVHVNRTLQDLRKTKLVSWRGSTVTITNFDSLARLVSFDPQYLNLRREPR